MTITYLHGFNSDGTGFKSEQLEEHFPDAQLLAPDLDANPEVVVAQVRELLKEVPPPLYLIGSSLGGFYALYFSAVLQVPCFLYNPSLRPHATLHRGIGRHQTWIKGRDYHFKEDYLTILERLKQEADPLTQPALLNFFLATDDDVLDLKPIPKMYPDANHLSWHKKVGHGFSKFKATLPTVEQLMQGYSARTSA